MEPSEAFMKAMDLLGQDPLPDDVFDQLDKLEAEIRDDELDMFGDLYEAAFAAGAVERDQ